MAVYAIDTYAVGPTTEGYVMTRITPPASTYAISVPPGEYAVVARLDSDPMSAAGYFTCNSGSCATRLNYVRLNASQSLGNIDIAGWGSAEAVDAIRRIDAFGSPMSATFNPSPSPSVTSSPTPLPVRQRPQGPTPPLPQPVDLPSYYQGGNLQIRLDLPADWVEVTTPVPPPYGSVTVYLANENVRSPLALDANGVFLVFTEFGGCSELNPAGASAQASFFNTPQGMANFYFRDAVGPRPTQPFQGFEYFGTKELRSGCFFFQFSGVSAEARDSNLHLFDQIVFQARYV